MIAVTELADKAEFLTDAEGNRKAAVIDIATWDQLITELRKLQTHDSTIVDKRAIVKKYPDDLPEQNRQLLELLRSQPPDDLGDEWWDEFEQELRQNRL